MGKSHKKKQTKNSPADSRYFNREFSWLEFNWRVLHEAMDERTPCWND
jgi:polyphosphate kinase